MKDKIINDILFMNEVPTPKWMLPSYGYLALSKSRLPRWQTREALFFCLLFLLSRKLGKKRKLLENGLGIKFDLRNLSG